MKIKDRIAKLVDVKSIITILVTIVMCWKGIIQNYDLEPAWLIIIGFYFGTQATKKKEGE